MAVSSLKGATTPDAPSLDRHLTEIETNRRVWGSKTLLRELYSGFYRRIEQRIDPALPGRVVEIGSGVGNLSARLPDALATDLFVNPWLDLAGDAYALPFRGQCLSHLVLFDVFHHLAAPGAFLAEARRVLVPRGRLIIFEPYFGLTSWLVYGLLHPEPTGWRLPLDLGTTRPVVHAYYAAQGNATRLFFRHEAGRWPEGWQVLSAEAFSAFAYLLSGGFSRPALYPERVRPALDGLDRQLSRWPRVFGARCLVTLENV